MNTQFIWAPIEVIKIYDIWAKSENKTWYVIHFLNRHTEVNYCNFVGTPIYENKSENRKVKPLQTDKYYICNSTVWYKYKVKA